MATAALEDIEDKALSEIQEAHYQRIMQLERKCDELETEYESDKHRAAASKKKWEKAISDLRTCIRKGPDSQRELPFQEAIDLTDKQAEKMEEIGVSTVEDFENLRAGNVKGYPGGLRDVQGWGSATVDKLDDAIVDWMTLNARDEPDASEEVEDPFEGDDQEDELDQD